MKANKIYAILLGCVLTFGLASCVEKAPEYVPGEPCTASVVVSPDLDSPRSLDLQGEPIEARFVRSNTSGDLQVNVSLKDDSGLFSLDNSTITFANGEKYASAYVKYNYDDLELTGSYKVEVTMASEQYASPYNAVTVPFSCVKGWINLGEGEFFDNLALMSADSYGIAKCTILQSPDGAPRYRIMHPYADQAQRAAAWDEACAMATPSEYIEFWVKDEKTMQVTWNNYWLTGLWYQGNPGDDIKAYLPSAKNQAGDENSGFITDYIVRFVPYYYIDGLGGFGLQVCYLSMPGGPDLEAWLDE